MKTIDILYLAIIFILVSLSAAFSSCDMAYSSVSQRRLALSTAKGDKLSAKALHYSKNYDSSIATILFGNDFVNVLSSSVTALFSISVLKSLLPDSYSVVGSLCLLATILIFGEITPKFIAKRHAYALSRFFVPFMDVMAVLFFPFVWPSSKFTSFLVSPLLKKAGKENTLVSDEELEAMVDAIEEEGEIDEDQSSLIRRSIDFKETSCYEVMTPRVNVFGYDTDMDFESFITRDKVLRHSRIIVYQGNFDHVLGYIPVKTLLRELVKGKKADYQSVMVPIVNVPRTMMISTAMELMKASKHHIAVVRDEYGGMEGIVTMEDILEELVGEVWDEKDNPIADIRKSEKRNAYYVLGKTNIDDFYNFMGLDPDKLLPDDYSTVSGWIIDHLGRFAKVGDSFRTGPIEVKVIKCDEFTVKEAFVRFIKKK